MAGCWQWPTAFLLVALLAAFGCASRAGQAAAAPARPAATTPAAPLPPPVYPAAEWDRAPSSEDVGFSSAKLEQVRAKLQTMATTGLVAVAQGRVFFEHGNVTEVSYIASVRKSILAMLYGNYVESGKVRLDKTLKELGITDHGGLSDQELEATIADLLGARSGIYHAASNGGDDLASAPPRGSQPHGTYYLYSNWDFNALGTIFEQETGRPIYDALEAELARPIGMQDFQRDLHKKSGDLKQSIHPAYHMHFSTRDMARIGYLMLREGNWAGRQIVPKAWTKRIVTPVTRVGEMNPPARRQGRFGYGYLWWVFGGPAATGPYQGAYTGVGAGGQYITVLPKLDLVVAHKKKVPPSDRSVAAREYLEVLDLVVAAYTGAAAER